MTKVSDLTTDLIIAKKEITEPIAAQSGLSGQLSRFPEEVYNLTADSHLYRLISALAGEVGAGALKKELLLPKLQQMLDSTHFKDLDLLYGNPLGLPRLNLETYDFDPQGTALTQTQWQEVRAKDADYRCRCLIWMRAILHGATLEGIALAAEAALGVECDIYERYKYLENLNSDTPANLFAYYSFEGNSEFSNSIVARGDTPPKNAWSYTLAGSAIAPTIPSGVSIYGSRYVQAVSAAGASDSVLIKTYNTLRIDPTMNYAFSAFWRRSSGTGDSKSSMVIACFDESGALTGTLYPTNGVSGCSTPGTSGAVNPNAGVTSTTWQRWGGYITPASIPANTVTMQPQIFVYGLNSVVGTIQVDAIQFEQGTEATGFGLRIPGTTNSNNEVVIVPQAPDITDEERRRAMRLVDRLRPTDTVPTLTSGDRVRMERPAVATAASSSTYNVQRFVTGRSDVDWPDVDTTAGFWIVPGVEVEAPTFAWFDRQEAATFLSIQFVTATTTKVGNFNRQQRQLFPQLAAVTDPFDTHNESRSFAKAFAQLTFSIPWINRST